MNLAAAFGVFLVVGGFCLLLRLVKQENEAWTEQLRKLVRL